MAIISDATALILLAKVDLLEIFTEKNEIIIPEKVYYEIIAGKEKSKLDAFLIEKLVKNKTIKITKVNEYTKKIVQDLFNLQKGELEVISLAYENKDIVLTDDMKCIRAAKSLKINFINSLAVVVALHNKGRINKKIALKAIDQLEEFGWYKKELIKTYREAIK